MDETPRPTNLTDKDPVHFARYASKGGVPCDEMKDRDFGALWNGVEGFSNTGQAGQGAEPTNFRFTIHPQFVTCSECIEIISHDTDTLQELLRAVREWMGTDEPGSPEIIEAAGEWIEAGCPGLKK